MASLTVRKLDEALKASLRLRAARSGRSVEDEVRTILRDAAGVPAALVEKAPAKGSRRVRTNRPARPGAILS